MRTRGRGSSTRSAKRLPEGSPVSLAWIILILSGTLEAVWANALAATKGFTRLGPSIVFFVSVVLSMGGLAYAMIDLPAGTAYAVWVAIGATLTAVWAMVTKRERATVLRVVLLTGLVMCVVGLKLVS